MSRAVRPVNVAFYTEPGLQQPQLLGLLITHAAALGLNTSIMPSFTHYWKQTCGVPEVWKKCTMKRVTACVAWLLVKYKAHAIT